MIILLKYQKALMNGFIGQGFQLSIPPFILWLAFFGVALLTLIMTSIMYYHYRDFKFEKIRMGLIGLIHIAVSAMMLILSLAFISLYISSI